MKDLTIQLLDSLHDGTLAITDARFSIVGGSYHFTLDVGGQPLHLCAERLEIVSVMQQLGHVRGHDPATKQLYCTDSQDAMTMNDALTYEVSDYVHLHRCIIQHLLQCAQHILDATESAEDLWLRYFYEYSLTEKTALLWRLAQQTSIEDYHVSTNVQHILNYLSGAMPAMPRQADLRVQVFAKWLKDNKGSLYGLCPPEAVPSGYTTTLA